MVDVSAASTVIEPPALTTEAEVIDASVVAVIVFVDTAPTPAPDIENPALAVSVKLIAAASASMLPPESASTSTLPPAVTEESSMVARVEPPIWFSARVTDTVSAAAPVEPLMLAAMLAMSEVICEVSSAVTLTAPPAVTMDPLTIEASVLPVMMLRPDARASR
jgi:hypothetical protein